MGSCINKDKALEHFFAHMHWEAKVAEGWYQARTQGGQHVGGPPGMSRATVRDILRSARNLKLDTHWENGTVHVDYLQTEKGNE